MPNSLILVYSPRVNSITSIKFKILYKLKLNLFFPFFLFLVIITTLIFFIVIILIITLRAYVLIFFI